MFTLTINGNTPEELFANLKSLAANLTPATVFTPGAAPSPSAPIAPIATIAPAPAAYQTAATTVDNPVPTAAPQYTLEMIATAGTALVDAGKMEALCALLGKYGIDSLVKLDPSQYGAFATDLRGLGAQL